jgi:hypothetical protein
MVILVYALVPCCTARHVLKLQVEESCECTESGAANSRNGVIIGIVCWGVIFTDKKKCYRASSSIYSDVLL